LTGALECGSLPHVADWYKPLEHVRAVTATLDGTANRVLICRGRDE
jgi:hypothetical protein